MLIATRERGNYAIMGIQTVAEINGYIHYERVNIYVTLFSYTKTEDHVTLSDEDSIRAATPSSNLPTSPTGGSQPRQI
ncbi:hypothetical protein TNCV_2411121 [Trichonephila clavipes]|nr:hypothetical protein TNCV_2411121 [Trichonephila clavipes]